VIKSFFAVSNGHSEKPPIIEASDSKWWLWKNACLQCGFQIDFINEKYMRDMDREHNK
jgi:hypothetical protein